MANMKTATELKRNLDGFNGDARLYRCAPPLDGHEYVIVSAAVVFMTGPETYIFGATKDGEIENWSELDGSFRGGLDHVHALNEAGYEVTP